MQEQEQLLPKPAEPGPAALDGTRPLFPAEPPRMSVFTKKARVYMDVLLVTAECCPQSQAPAWEWGWNVGPWPVPILLPRGIGSAAVPRPEGKMIIHV